MSFLRLPSRWELFVPANWGGAAWATQLSRLGDDLYPDNNGGVGIKCEHQARQDKYIENQATNTNGQTDFNWTLKAATIPVCPPGPVQHFSGGW